jgi:cytochrome c biogenesis protein CcdA/thiol-disulfide isomerase/thioredoxin
MLLLLLFAFLAGLLTLASPCIVPVLPFVFASTVRPWRQSTLALLAGMGLAFVAAATLATVTFEWAATMTDYSRSVALGLLALSGLTLIWPALGERLSRPFVAMGQRLGTPPDSAAPSVARALLLGVATGLLWTPCAGPMLGLILSSAALSGPGWSSTTLLVVYALGAITGLGLGMLAGRKLWARQLTAPWVRTLLGIGVLTSVMLLATGLDSRLASWLPSNATAAALELDWMQRVRPTPAVTGTPNQSATLLKMQDGPARAPLALPAEGRLTDLSGAVQWLNSPPLTALELRGKVVLIDFWTFGCYNCLNALPHVREWDRKFRDQGLVVIGVHTPEFAHEKVIANVSRALKELGVTFPVAVDNQYRIWNSFGNQYWPAHYFIDAKGVVRWHHFGEGEYEKSERVIQQLLEEAKKGAV